MSRDRDDHSFCSKFKEGPDERRGKDHTLNRKGPTGPLGDSQNHNFTGFRRPRKEDARTLEPRAVLKVRRSDHGEAREGVGGVSRTAVPMGPRGAMVTWEPRAVGKVRRSK